MRFRTLEIEMVVPRESIGFPESLVKERRILSRGIGSNKHIHRDGANSVTLRQRSEILPFL